jgi:hypothetical protein
MPIAQNPSNFHHYTPKSVLRRFSQRGERRQVAVFDKMTERSWTAGLRETGSAQGYNTLVQPDGSELNFEVDFDAIDLAYAEVGDALAARRDISGLDPDFKLKLADATAVQALRTPIVRSTLTVSANALITELRDKGLPAPDEADPLDDNIARQLTREMIADRDRIRAALLAKDLILFEPAGKFLFWTSDHPVVRYSNAPTGETGFESLGVEIYLPIASDLMLGFICPSLLKRLTRVQLELLDMTTEIKSRLIAQRDAILQGSPLAVSDEDVRWFNSMQVAGSTRFVYAANIDFELARKMLRSDPELKSTDSLLRMGRLGEAPPRSSNLPAGEWVYLEGAEHWRLIAITDWSLGRQRQMTTTDIDQLRLAVAEGPFVSAQVFADAGSQLMRGASLEVLDWGPPARFQLVFSDPALRGLDAILAERENRDP